MARRRKDDGFFDDVFDLLKITPIWVGPMLAVIVFALFRYVAPLLFPPKADGFNVGIVLRQAFPMLAWVFAGGVLVAWLAAEVHKLFNRRVLDGQRDIDSVRELSWPTFERLVTEAYRRKGYLAETVGSAGGDGGVDVELHGHGETILVQCKQWRAFKVGVKTVREMLGVVTSRRASRGIVVTSGRFTDEAIRFAEQNPQIELVDGPRLAALVREVQRTPPSASASPSVPVVQNPPPRPSQQPACPACGTAMVRRQARRGANAGSEFWGCPRYPACRGTRPC